MALFVLQPSVGGHWQGKAVSSRALDTQPSHTQMTCSVSGISGVPQDTISPSTLKTLTFRTPLAVKKTLLRSGKTIPPVSKLMPAVFGGVYSHMYSFGLWSFLMSKKGQTVSLLGKEVQMGQMWEVPALLSLDAPITVGVPSHRC